MIFIRKVSKTEYSLWAITGLLAFLLAWTFLSSIGIIKPIFLPSPWAVVLALRSLFSAGTLTSDILISLFRILVGCLCSLVAALPIGILISSSKKIEAFVEPLISFVRYVPPSAFIPLAIIWFGIGESQKILIIFLGVAPYLTLLIADIAGNTRRDLVDAALTLGASPYDLILRVILPNSLPGIWDSLRIMVGAAWTFVIIAEIVGASSGLGHLMIESQRFLRTDNIFAAIVAIGLLGLCTDYFFKVCHRVFFKWTEKSYA